MNKKTIKDWKKHLQDEIDTAALYRFIASRTLVDKKKSKLYSDLALVEDKHTAIWKDLFKKNNIPLGKNKISLKANFIIKFTKLFGNGLLTYFLLKEEGNEVKKYLGLFTTSDSKDAKELALKLAKDSAGHSEQLSQLDGSSSEPWHSSESGGVLRNIVYGFNDGLTANFGLIAGVIGANPISHLILISGISGMIADSLSMGSSGFLAAASEKELNDNERKMEEEEIRLMPELEAEELSLTYQAKGLSKSDAENLATKIMQNPEQALDEEVREELGISNKKISPLKEGWITGTATAVGAFIPIIPFLFFNVSAAIWISLTISMLAHFVVGAARSFFTGRGIFKSGIDMFLVGMGVAIAGYFIGELISKLL